MSVFVTFHPYWRTYAWLQQLTGCSSSGVCIQRWAVTFLHLERFACRGRQRKRNKIKRDSESRSLLTAGWCRCECWRGGHIEETLSIQTIFFFQSCCVWHIILHILPGKTESPCHNDKHRIHLQLYGVHLSSCCVITCLRCGLKWLRGSQGSLSTEPRTL